MRVLLFGRDGKVGTVLMGALRAAGHEVDGVEVGDEIEVLMEPSYRMVDQMVTRVGELGKAGYRTALLTNTFAEFQPTMQRDIDFDLFDVVVESFAVGSRKPERAIYEITQTQLGVDHDAIVYLDDFEQNLGPATSLGWTTILVSDPGAAITEVRSILGGSGYDPK